MISSHFGAKSTERAGLRSLRFGLVSDVYAALDTYKRDLFWNLKLLRHSKQKSDIDELSILEVCYNPLLAANYKYFPYCENFNVFFLESLYLSHYLVILSWDVARAHCERRRRG